MPALEPLRGLRVVADPAALDGARWQRPDVTVSSASRPTTSSPSAPRPSTSTTSTRSSNRRPGSPAPGSRSRSSRTTSSGRSRRSGPPSPRGSSRPSRPRSGCPTTARPCSLTAAAYARRARRDASDERLHGHAAGDPLARAEVELRRRHRRRRRPRPVDRLLPRDAAWDHRTSPSLEADYIASGNTGRNTTIIRANYGIPEAVRFYQHSLEMYQGLEEETGAAILHQTKGIFWVAHTEMAMRTERARVPDEHGLRREDRDGQPGRAQGARPAGRPDRRRPLPGPGRLAPPRGARPPGTTGSPGRSPPARRSAASTSSSTRR